MLSLTWKSLSSTSTCGAILLAFFLFSEFIDCADCAKHNFSCKIEIKQSISKILSANSSWNWKSIDHFTDFHQHSHWHSFNVSVGLNGMERGKTAMGQNECFSYLKLPVAIVAVADVLAATDDCWDSDVDDDDDKEFEIFELDESFLALVLFP